VAITTPIIEGVITMIEFIISTISLWVFLSFLNAIKMIIKFGIDLFFIDKKIRRDNE
jgi:hypothetical protein